jgi:hypothetical protein
MNTFFGRGGEGLIHSKLFEIIRRTVKKHNTANASNFWMNSFDK